MSRYLTVFFSAGGTTARAARAVAGAVDADLFEIRPAVSYTAADLNWNNPASRTSVEMNDEACRPELASAEEPTSRSTTPSLSASPSGGTSSRA